MGRKLIIGVIAHLVAIAVAVPVKADTDAQDQQLLAALKAAGWNLPNPSEVITLGNMVCNEGLAHGVTWQEMRSTLISSYGFSRLDASTLISKAVAVYCPKYTGALKGIGDDLGKPASGGDQGDQFVQSLKEKWGISIGKGAAVEMAETACNSPLAGTGYANALQEMQQRYPKYDINTVARVMAAGILAYCPQRLS